MFDVATGTILTTVRSDQVISRPDWSAYNPEVIEQTLDTLLQDCRSIIERVSRETSPAWDTLVAPQEHVHNRLNLFWSPVSHLHAVKNDDAWRDMYKRCLAKLSAYHTELGQHEALYQATLALQGSDAFTKLSAAQQRAIDNDIRDFELGGVSLNNQQKQRFGEISEELSKLGNTFSEHVLDATQAWQKCLDSAQSLQGLPTSALAAARERAEAKGKPGEYLLNLEFPTYHAVMTFADDRALREEMYTAFVTRASDQGPQAGKFDNTAIIEKTLALRAEQAALLGYDSYADLSMVRKMVDSPVEVIEFLEDLAERAVPMAQKEFDTLAAFAKDELGIDELAAWDMSYAGDKYKKRLHNISDEDLKPYFPADHAINGMFEVVGRLFGLVISRVHDVPVYHADVSCFAIHDRSGALRGQFYLDNYAREGKRGGAWMAVCASRQTTPDGVQLPIAYLTCNLTPPVGDEPALLTHQEVITLFHEFGHGLHHMLTRVDVAGVSGINGVEWDAVELPSQFLESWCWERESLDLISSHYQTGEKLPDDMLGRLRGARQFQAGMQLVRQLEFSLFDMRIHLESIPSEAADVQGTLDAVRERVSVIPTPAFNRFQHGFSHIFAGGYSAGYFSYKWAEVLSTDAYGRFEEEGVFNQDAGRDFMIEVLEQGGSRDALTSFTAFRGRKPTVDALLRHSGLAA